METHARKILIIDDSATTRSLIASVLEQLGNIEILEANSGFEALKVLPSTRFDLIVTDINMPDINGLEVISFLKKHPHYRSIPVIIISTERSQKDRRKGLMLGADEYITKPFEATKLFETVQRILVKV
jgi:two-component system, chemotaxis family, chemotaxis protein CheY